MKEEGKMNRNNISINNARNIFLFIFLRVFQISMIFGMCILTFISITIMIRTSVVLGLILLLVTLPLSLVPIILVEIIYKKYLISNVTFKKKYFIINYKAKNKSFKIPYDEIYKIHKWKDNYKYYSRSDYQHSHTQRKGLILSGSLSTEIDNELRSRLDINIKKVSREKFHRGLLAKDSPMWNKKAQVATYIFLAFAFIVFIIAMIIITLNNN